MGYTHYWKNIEGFTKLEWDNILADTNKLFNVLPKDLIDDEEGNAPIAVPDQIYFNGVNVPYETFVLEQGGKDFNFCKTAHKPYDLAVTSVLLIAKHYKANFDISSDGGEGGWVAAKELIKTEFGYNIETNDR